MPNDTYKRQRYFFQLVTSYENHFNESDPLIILTKECMCGFLSFIFIKATSSVINVNKVISSLELPTYDKCNIYLYTIIQPSRCFCARETPADKSRQFIDVYLPTYNFECYLLLSC